VAATFVSVSGYWVAEHFEVLGGRTFVRIDTSQGRLRVEWRRLLHSSGVYASDRHFVHTRAAPAKPLGLVRMRGADLRDYRAGRFAYQSGSLQDRFRILFTPCWVVAAVSAALPAWWLVVVRRRWRRDRRREAGRCPECGYDLTGNLSGVCPECGTAP
jgi:hypothetical protein